MKSATGTTVALATAAALLAPFPSAAMANPAVVPSSPRLVKTAKVDVDGDGRRDTVRIYQVSSVSYRVSVTTARKKSASRNLTTDPATFVRMWAGSGTLDGSRGHELMVNVSGSEAATWYQVLTWRSGRLVEEPGPAGPPDGDGTGWGGLGMGTAGQGMHFFTKAGKRYVDVGYWSCDGSVCQASVERSVWRSHVWHKVKHFTRHNITEQQTRVYWGITGVRVSE